jgi:hypothetical protein
VVPSSLHVFDFLRALVSGLTVHMHVLWLLETSSLSRHNRNEAMLIISYVCYSDSRGKGLADIVRLSPPIARHQTSHVYMSHSRESAE